MEQFTRRETVILSRTSPGRLDYLAKTGVVVPICPPDSQNRQSLYSWEQVLELRTIRHLRRQVSLQMIRKILAFLEKSSGDRTLHNKHLIINNGEVDWVQADSESKPQVIQVAAKANRHIGQLKLMTVPAVSDLISDVWETASQSKVIDFESFRKRALHSPFK
ncbi:MAG: MerR family transcriptional regulator [Leptolyngbya sp. SIO1D8]|nr:MerR family transcriptional regulator [Leptolyngbya sp. SIO1D8]